MTAPAALQGNLGSYLLIDGDEYDTDAMATKITNSDKDESDLTFQEAADGDTKDSQFVVTFLQSLLASSLFRKIWDDPGASYPVIWGPRGNTVATATEPHLLFTIKANGKPEIGNSARFTKQRENTEYTWDITSAIVLDDGA